MGIRRHGLRNFGVCFWGNNLRKILVNHYARSINELDQSLCSRTQRENKHATKSVEVSKISAAISRWHKQDLEIAQRKLWCNNYLGGSSYPFFSFWSLERSLSDLWKGVGFSNCHFASKSRSKLGPGGSDCEKSDCNAGRL